LRNKEPGHVSSCRIRSESLSTVWTNKSCRFLRRTNRSEASSPHCVPAQTNTTALHARAPPCPHQTPFPTQHRDRAPYGALIASLLATRRPEASGFLGTIDRSAHGKHSDVLPVLSAALDAYDPEVRARD